MLPIEEVQSLTWSKNVIQLHGNMSNRATAIKIGMGTSIDHFQKICRGERPADRVLHWCKQLKDVYIKGPMGVPLWDSTKGRYTDNHIENVVLKNYDFINYYNYGEKTDYLNDYMNAKNMGITLQEFNSGIALSHIIQFSTAISDTANFLISHRKWRRIRELWPVQHSRLEAAYQTAYPDLLSCHVPVDRFLNVLSNMYKTEIEEIFFHEIKRKYQIDYNDVFSPEINAGNRPSFDITWLSQPRRWYATYEAKLKTEQLL